MKKVLLVATIMVAGFMSADAQTEKGNFLLGGNVTFQTSDGTSVFMAAPNLGYFVANNIAVGARVNLLTSEGYTAWAAGPFVRGYFLGSDKGKFFGEGGVNIGGADGADTEVGFGVGAGYAIFLNRSVALEFGANYTKTGEAEGIFGLGVGFQIHFIK